MATDNTRLGSYVTENLRGFSFPAFIPPALPPQPPVALESFYALYDQTLRAIGDLSGISRILPDQDLFLSFHIRKEALLSSQIEGTQSSLADIMLFEQNEAVEVPSDDIEEVFNYIRALNFAMAEIRREGGPPLTLRVLNDAHAILLRGARGSDKKPGEFRNGQVWLGGERDVPRGAIFIPPPARFVPGMMADLERFIHSADPLPGLVKAAYAHVQFETIHPYNDGNGRLGRLLITLILQHLNLLEQPLLYLSLYLKNRRTEYYDRLQAVRVKGDWEGWLRFFLEGVLLTAQQAVRTAEQCKTIFDNHQEKVAAISKRNATLHNLYQYMQRNPIFTINSARAALKVSPPTLRHALNKLIAAGLVTPDMQRKRNRHYIYAEYWQLLSEGAQPL